MERDGDLLSFSDGFAGGFFESFFLALKRRKKEGREGKKESVWEFDGAARRKRHGRRFGSTPSVFPLKRTRRLDCHTEAKIIVWFLCSPSSPSSSPPPSPSSPRASSPSRLRPVQSWEEERRPSTGRRILRSTCPSWTRVEGERDRVRVRERRRAKVRIGLGSERFGEGVGLGGEKRCRRWWLW